jgi:hypothetical protein
MFSVISVLAIGYALLCLLLFALQRQMIYFPTPETSVPGVAHIVLDRGDVRIKVWTLNPGKSRALLYFGGNAEQVAANIDSFKTLFADRTVYLLNYRGYGGSSGTPDEAGLYSDALLAYDHFSKFHRETAVMGRSIGSAVATYVAAKRPVKRLLLITPFDRAISVASKLYPIFPMGVLLRDRYDSLDRACDINAETLIVAAEEDGIIPRQSTERLANALKQQTQLQVAWLREVDHNSVHLHPAYAKVIAEFMR